MKAKKKQKRNNPLRALLPYLLVIPAALVGFNLLANPPPPKAEGVKVIGVIDGDTLVLDGKSRVRLRHVDAAEKGLCGNNQATLELTKLTLGKKVRIEETVPDRYGRGMALAYTGDTLINEEMVATGWVRYHSDISTKALEIKSAADGAREKKLGVFGTCQSTTNADQPKCNIKGNIDKSTDTHIYYIPGCAQYAFTIVEKDIGEAWFCTESQAKKAGYVKAKTCL